MLGHEQKRAFVMSSSLKFPSVFASLGRSAVVRNATGSLPPDCSVGRKVPKQVIISYLRA